MELCLKVALSVVFLAACLEATPLCQQLVNPLNVSYDLEELGLQFISSEVKCGANVTFVSPNNVDVDNCMAVALESFKDGLEQAKANCADRFDRITDTQSHMTSREERAERQCVTSTTLSQCQWSDKKPLGEFLEDFKTLVNLRNNAASRMRPSASS